MANIVITARNYADLTPDAVEALKAAGHSVTVYPDGMSMDREAFYDAVKDAEGVIVSLEKFDSELLHRLPRLKVISRRGVGVDSIDMDAARDLGIHVARTFGLVEASVAEYALAAILYFARRLHEQTAPLHAHKWQRMLTLGAKSRTLGIVGFGGIGTELAKRADALGMRILYNARNRRSPEQEAQYHAEYRPLDELLAESDFVVAAVPLTQETTGLFGKEQFARMKPTAYFINVARAQVADEEALAEALRSGAIAGAATDVHPHEPCPDSRFTGMDNVLLTPHTAPYTEENFAGMNRAAAQNVIDFFTK